MFRKLSTDQLNRLTIYQYKAGRSSNLQVLLDNVRSMHNTGSIFRSCDCFGVEKLHLCGITPCPPHRDIHRTALGAELSLPWSHHSSAREACLELKKEGFRIAAVEQTQGSVPPDIFSTRSDEKLLLVFGSETDGVSQEVLDLCDAAIEIPQFGTKHSFNVSVSAGIVLWEMERQRGSAHV